MIPKTSVRIDELVKEGQWTKPEEKKVDTGAKLVSTTRANNHTMSPDRVWVEAPKEESKPEGEEKPEGEGKE